MRVKHYSLRTEKSYIDWIKRYIWHFDKRPPKDMEAQQVEVFLTHLAVQRNVSASTQNQAKTRCCICIKRCWVLICRGYSHRARAVGA